MKQNSFQVLAAMAMQVPGREHMRPVIEKELLHYDILFALDQQGLLDQLTFQGGTSLRLCYGAPRFSEDLDFAGGYAFTAHDFLAVKSCLEQYIGKRYSLEVMVKEPKVVADLTRDGIKVNIWQVRIVTSPEQRDIPKQMIKIEIVNLPAYTREPRLLHTNYDFLPDGYSDILIMTESLSEILADKLIAFINCESHIRYRDIWDLRWLKQQGASINVELVKNKLSDYQVVNYLPKLEHMCKQLPEIIASAEFKHEISRFIPADVQQQTLLKDKFCIFLQNEVTSILQQVKVLLSDNEA